MKTNWGTRVTASDSQGSSPMPELRTVVGRPDREDDP